MFGGLRYQCALALSGGRAGCLVPQQPPAPSAEVDGVLLWKHGYTQALLPQSTYLHSAWKKKNENCIFTFLDSFPFFFPKINASQGSLSMVCAYPGSLFPVSITKWNIKYICRLQRTSFCLNHFPWNLKKKKKKKSYVCIYQCDSPYPHQAVNDIDLMALLQGPLWNDKARSMWN